MSLSLERIDRIRNAIQCLIEESFFTEEGEARMDGWIQCLTWVRRILYPKGKE